jgi:hypothetical protein
MAIKKNPTPTVRPTIKGATKPFMAPSFNVPTGPKSNGINMPSVSTGSAKKKKSNVSSGKGIDLVKDKMRASVQKTKMKVRSSTVSRGSGNCGAGNNLCKSNSKF